MAQRVAPAIEGSIADLADLVPRLHRSEGFAEVVEALTRGEPAVIDGAWGSACALSTAALATDCPATLLVVLPRIHDVDDFADDVAGFLEERPLVFPAWETLPEEHSMADAVFGRRLRVLNEVEHSSPRMIVTSLPALLQPVPPRQERAAGTWTIRVGEEIDPETLLAKLVERGFVRAPAIEMPGEFAMHGGILDVFPPDAADPLRIEFFGDEIESIRRFDVETQRKVEELERATLTLVAAASGRCEPAGASPSDDRLHREPSDPNERRTPGGPMHRGADAPRSPGNSESLLDSLPTGSWVAITELEDLVAEGRHYLERLPDRRGLYSVDAALAHCARFPLATISAITAGRSKNRCSLRIESIERFTGPPAQAIEELAAVVAGGQNVLIACHNEGERQRLRELLTETDIAATWGRPPGLPGRLESLPHAGLPGRSGDDGSGRLQRLPHDVDIHNGRLESLPHVRLCLGRLARGFRLVDDATIVLSDHELFGRTEIRRGPRRKRAESRAIDSFLELNEGDLVVHLTHGIARFQGMELLRKDEQAEEHLRLEFDDKVVVYVPVSLIHLVQKYVGAGKVSPRLSKLGGAGWAKKKSRVASAVSDMASDMLRLQAERAEKPGIVFPEDSAWLHEFEAAFPYVETDDQLHAIEDLKADMQRRRPMDRLICGDVGYGKTEVAMRAAFKAIDAGKQVAVLVPTTVLAEQHVRTFRERMAEYPFEIEVLSRFRTKGEQKEILERLERGAVDLIIGTHRIVQDDVRFKDLGLIVIDEEQRFGVEAKEKLKRLRLEVDVLTLSATPIPRTLHMSLLGIRDISNLITPPMDRIAIETRIVRWDRELIRNAIVRELNRNGQIYFVHNRVQSIHQVAERLQEIVPEARIAIGHGQMSGDELEEAMTSFVRAETDILVCTTIIESGLDIPNANTIFIHQADRYGLADLHQLRGRVGRYKHRAYCYMVLDESKPITTAGRKRLKAIEEFSELGAGFKIAMRDLEIRGAGSILGTAQSGHIATVGYELYCQLLENAVRRLKNEPIREHRHVTIDLPIAAWIPDEYVPPGRQKIDLYRKLSHAANGTELREIEDELRDRFGPIPDEVTRLFGLKELQLHAQARQIDDIRLEDGYARFGYRSGPQIRKLAAENHPRLRVVDGRSAYLVLQKPDATNDELLATLKSVLRPNG
ncbi:MAG: transcription-repair coupling factor [Planctomycetaceae bacterium]